MLCDARHGALWRGAETTPAVLAHHNTTCCEGKAKPTLHVLECQDVRAYASQVSTYHSSPMFLPPRPTAAPSRGVSLRQDNQENRHTGPTQRQRPLTAHRHRGGSAPLATQLVPEK